MDVSKPPRHDRLIFALEIIGVLVVTAFLAYSLWRLAPGQSGPRLRGSGVAAGLGYAYFGSRLVARRRRRQIHDVVGQLNAIGIEHHPGTEFRSYDDIFAKWPELKEPFEVWFSGDFIDWIAAGSGIVIIEFRYNQRSVFLSELTTGTLMAAIPGPEFPGLEASFADQACSIAFENRRERRRILRAFGPGVATGMADIDRKWLVYGDSPLIYRFLTPTTIDVLRTAPGHEVWLAGAGWLAVVGKQSFDAKGLMAQIQRLRSAALSLE